MHDEEESLYADRPPARREVMRGARVVVGSRGHGGFASMLLGSTSIQSVMHATCPVTVVHSAEAHRHRLRLHRERRDQRPDDRPDERRGGVENPSETAPLR
jgi:hypothetical protein